MYKTFYFLKILITAMCFYTFLMHILFIIKSETNYKNTLDLINMHMYNELHHQYK